MKRKLTLLASLAFLATANFASAQAPTITANDAKIQYTGRIDYTNPLQPKYAYPSVSIKAKFNGTGITATIHDYGTGAAGTTNYYKVFIDDVIVSEQLQILSPIFGFRHHSPQKPDKLRGLLSAQDNCSGSRLPGPQKHVAQIPDCR